ncbi:MAG TPA: YncE family protein [Fimbriimonadaceae bacterium]|nr:YncE family protein [Fimbriimonadaceae bacterium]
MIAALLAALATSAPLTVVARVPLPGSATRFDYQSLDSTSGLLYVSHMGAGRLVVFDTKRRKVVADLPEFPLVTGVLAVPQEGKVYASAAGAHEVVVMDSGSQKTLTKVSGARFPDGIAYVPDEHRVFVSDESGRIDLAIDSKTGEVLAKIPLEGEAGNTHFDSVGGHVWVAVQTRNQMVEIDPVSMKVVARHPLAGSDHPHGFLIDAKDRLAFVSCEGNDRLLVAQMPEMTVIQNLEVGGGPDVLAYDRGLKRLYVGCERGEIDVFRLVGERLERLGEFRAPRAHSVCVDQKTHLVYAPIEKGPDGPEMLILEPSKGE